MTRRRLSIAPLEDRIAPAANSILTNEHIDLEVNHDAAGWSMVIRDDDFGVDYPAESSVQYVNTAFAGNTRPADPAFDFLGVPAGATFYRLPNLQNPNLLYHGIAASAVAPGTFDVYDPAVESKGRQTGSGRWARLQLTGFSGPGTFALFRNGDFGPVRFISTYQDGIANPDTDGIDYTDGLGPHDAYWILEGAHAHLNFTFSAPGRYELTFRPSAFIGGSLSVGPEFTFVYSVQNVGQINFATTSYSVNEAAGVASITLTRTGGSDGAVSVDYATTPGSATEDVDYEATTGTLTFFDEEVTKTFTIPIINDPAAEPSETIGLALSNFRPWNKPGGGAEDPPIAGTTTSATLTIVDDDSAPPLAVAGVTINGGAVQRSRVTAIDVAFNQLATVNPAGFQFVRQSDGLIVALTSAIDSTGPTTVARLTFGGLGAEGGSLLDGRYTLTVIGSAQPGMTGDFTLVGSPANGLFRLYGDADGSGQVDIADFLAFRLAFLNPSAAFDLDGGGVGSSDFLRFRLNFLALV